MKRLILIRHGQSEWNLQNRFTGWTDIDLTDKGREEARHAGKLIASAGLEPRYCFTSYQKRAIHTLQLALDAMDRDWLPVVKDWHLNERHYGALQGLNKAETAQKYGDEQVHIRRRSYDVEPPLLTPSDDRYPGRDPRYAALSADELPLGESLKDTIARVRPCWEELIEPRAAPLRHSRHRRPRQQPPRTRHDAQQAHSRPNRQRGNPHRLATRLHPRRPPCRRR